jgi:hypothetical protein
MEWLPMIIAVCEIIEYIVEISPNVYGASL